jgi:hypothetical protein
VTAGETPSNYSRRCRRAAHGFHRGAATRASTFRPLRFAYGDPPYPGKAGYYVGYPDGAGEVDHDGLLERLDGWALSTPAAARPSLLPSCPPAVRIAAWFRGERPTPSFAPLSAWEPVIVHGGRAYLSPVDARRIDALVHVTRPRATDPGRAIETKPAAFYYWLFDLLGALRGDELTDLFPGSGGTTSRAWRWYSSLGARGDAS